MARSKTNSTKSAEAALVTLDVAAEPTAVAEAAGAATVAEAPDGFGSGKNAHIVIFQSGNGFFGIDIGMVQEIVLMQEITPIPGGAPYIAGMTDLRGRVIPVAAFTELLGIAPSEQTDDTRILVVENAGGHIGFIVNAVSEVMMVDGSRIEDASALGAREHDFIVGVAKLEEHLVSLVDVPRLLVAADRGAAALAA
jgi:purine-binding chemotaxis protein CheW